MTKKKSTTPWPWFLLGLTVLFLSLSGWSVYRANHDVSSVVPTDAGVPGGSKRLPRHHE